MNGQRGKDGTRWVSLPLALACLVALAGCGEDDGLGRRAVSGEVTLDGEPLREAVVLLEPEAGSEAGTAVGATVQGGRFAIGSESGPVPGRYRVRLYASAGVQADPEPGRSAGSPRPMRERLPPRYNRDTTLTAEVRPDGGNAFRFALTSDPERSDAP